MPQSARLVLNHVNLCTSNASLVVLAANDSVPSVFVGWSVIFTHTQQLNDFGYTCQVI